MMDKRETKLRLSKIKPALMKKLEPYQYVELTHDMYIRLVDLAVTHIKRTDPIILHYTYPDFYNKNDRLFIRFAEVH